MIRTPTHAAGIAVFAEAGIPLQAGYAGENRKLLRSKHMTPIQFLVKATAAVVLFVSAANAQLPNLADITGINWDIPNRRLTVGTPENPIRTIERTGQAIVGAPAKQFILTAKANAGPAYAVPPAMYQQLLDLGVRRDLLDRARWSTNWRSVDTVFTADANAVTLQEVIVFRNQSDVWNNPVLWVHELKHFEQYERLGLDRFAAEYTVNKWVYENEATDAENRAARSRGAAGNQQQMAGGWGNGPNQPAPPQMVRQNVYYSYCATPAGNSPTIQGGYPQGSGCRWGPSWGTVVGFYR